MFNVGNRIKITNKQSASYRLEGLVKEIDQTVFPPIFGVVFDGMNHVAYYYESEMELITTLPIGNQIPLGSTSMLMDEVYNEMFEVSKPKCDCGGFTVYASMAAEAHSPWCSVFNVILRKD